MRAVLAAALLALCASSETAACVPEPSWVPTLPNETAEQHAERIEQAAADRSTIWEYNRQAALVERASVSFLAEVVASTVTPEGHKVATVQPLLAVKGSLPARPIRLETYEVSGCAPFPAIDGEGALAGEGDLVFVFSGLEPHPELRPRGIDSLMTRRILNERLVQALQEHGLEELDR